MCALDSSTRWASAASAIGSVRSTTGLTTPPPINGHTCSRTAATMAAFSWSGRPRRGRGDGGPLGQQGAEVQLALGAALETDDREAAVDGERLDVPVQVLGADQVQDDVGTRSRGVLPELLDEVLLAVVDEDVRPQFGAPGELLRAARRDRDPGPDRLRQLDRHRADAAGAAVHQEGLAGAQVGHHEDVGPHRRGDLGQRRGLHQADALRYGEELAGRNGDLLRVTAARQQRAHGVADRPPGHPGTERDDTARALQTGVGGGAGRRIVEALPLEHVGTVHSAGDDLDEDLAVTGYGIGHLGPDERLGATGFGNRDRIHGREATPAGLARAGASSVRVAGAEASGSSASRPNWGSPARW